MSTSTNHENLNFDDLFKFKNEEKEIKHDSFMLMAAFLSEIEAIQEIKDINRKTLAKKIDSSGSYLTQVFRGNKPLNFFTLAKIQKALNIKFLVRAYSKDSMMKETMFNSTTPVNMVFNFSQSDLFLEPDNKIQFKPSYQSTFHSIAGT